MYSQNLLFVVRQYWIQKKNQNSIFRLPAEGFSEVLSLVHNFLVDHLAWCLWVPAHHQGSVAPIHTAHKVPTELYGGPGGRGLIFRYGGLVARSLWCGDSPKNHKDKNLGSYLREGSYLPEFTVPANGTYLKNYYNINSWTTIWKTGNNITVVVIKSRLLHAHRK
jgi:hypothetical protein